MPSCEFPPVDALRLALAIFSTLMPILASISCLAEGEHLGAALFAIAALMTLRWGWPRIDPAPESIGR